MEGRLTLLDFTYWINVCATDENLLVSAGADDIVDVFDRHCINIFDQDEPVHYVRLTKR